MKNTCSYDRLDADIAKVMMGINAVKGVEIGAGFRSVEQLGTEHSDEITPEGFRSNNAGGILGDFDGAGHRGVDCDQADLKHSVGAADD